eukprot:scaffold61537_cov66-Phaeocystis_antarctica.AAC.2
MLAKHVAVRRDDENAAPTIEGDDAVRNETSKVMPRSLTVSGLDSAPSDLAHAPPAPPPPA